MDRHRRFASALEYARRRCAVAIARHRECTLCRHVARQEGVGQFFRTVDKVQETVKFEPQEFITHTHGDKVVVFGYFVMHIKATGSTVRSAWARVWTVQAGKVIQFCEYVDTAAVSSAHTAAQRARSSAGS